MQLHLDRAAQALEVVAATNHALAALETRLAQRATAPRDALGDVLMVFGMSENGDIAVPQADQMDHGFIGASLAIGPHSIETRRVGAPVEQHGRRQPDLTLPDGDQRGVVRGYGDQAVDPPRDERLDAAPLDRRVLAGRDKQKIIAVALGEQFDAMHEAGEKDVGDVGNDHADETGRASAQGACCAIDLVAERRNRFDDLSAARLAHRAIAVDDIGRGSDGHSGPQGDVPDRRPRLRHVSSRSLGGMRHRSKSL